MSTTDTNVPQVIVNKLTSAEYATATKSPTEFYAVTDVEVPYVGTTLSTPSNVAYVATANIQDGAVTPAKASFTTYTTTEQVVGTWIDGETIYRRVVTFDYTKVPSNDVATIEDLSSWGIGTVVKLYGMLGHSTSNSFRPLTMAGGGTDDLRIDIDNNNLRIRTYSNWSAFTKNYIVVEYTKASA